MKSRLNHSLLATEELILGKSALLALEDGSLFDGYSFGITGTSVGELVFNTAMTGYQEIITDPSYASQIVTFTFPHIGNVGINQDDMESKKVWASGVVVQELSKVAHHWRSQHSLNQFLTLHRVIGISGVDTRAITKHLSQHGFLKACITTEKTSKEAIKFAKEAVDMQGCDLTKIVSCDKPYTWHEPLWQHQPPKETWGHVVVYDFGTKRQLLRYLVSNGLRVTVVPADTDSASAMALKPDGILLSNGPGDPDANKNLILIVKQLMNEPIAIFGVCFGFQLLALAAGAKTFKMKQGHHGSNHPVLSLTNQRVYISSQNHGFAVDPKTLPVDFEITYQSLFDETLQGFRHRHRWIYGFQGHPEASPGPHDMDHLFYEFFHAMKEKVSK